jgi:putative SOS response-associated peptidase YedK
MPRGVLLGEPDALGSPPYQRIPGEHCLVLAREPARGEVVPAAMRWGLTSAATPQKRVLQFRADQLRGKRVSRRARCLVPISGYVQPSGRRTRIGVTVVSAISLAIAAVWDDGFGGACFAIVSTEPNDVLAPAHHRMPALLPPALWSSWLDGRTLTAADLALVENPAPPAWLQAQAIRGAPADREPQASIAQQLRNMAPGTELWQPAERLQLRRDVVELRHAVG